MWFMVNISQLVSIVTSYTSVTLLFRTNTVILYPVTTLIPDAHSIIILRTNVYVYIYAIGICQDRNL